MPVPSDKSFTLTAHPGTDIWRKPPSVDVFNAPYLLDEATPLDTFCGAKVSLKGPFTLRYDQAGLLLRLTRPGKQDRWLKAGVEFYNELPCISTVACYAFADWSIYPAGTSTAPPPEVFTMEVRKESDENGISLWVYWVKDGITVPVREVAWFFAEMEGWEIEVGVMAARPAKPEGGGDLVANFWDFEVRLL